MMQSKSRTDGRWLLALAVVSASLICGGAANPGESSRDIAPPVCVSEAPGDAEIETPVRDKILDVIREHRRSASESWQRMLADAIYEESVEAAVDPLFVVSIVAKESSFRSRVVSRAGAVGLMQLRPWVARDVALRSDLEWAGHETLHSPNLNVRLGILYYKELAERFDGDAQKALTAYNYGPTRVSRQLRDGSYAGSRYAEQVMQLYGRLSAGRTGA